MVAFLLVFTVLRTAVNSDFVYSSMASTAIGFAMFKPQRFRLQNFIMDRPCTTEKSMADFQVGALKISPSVRRGETTWFLFGLICVSSFLFAMSCSFTNQLLAQLDLLRCRSESTAYKNDVHFLPKQLDEQVGHCSCLHSVWSSPPLPRNIQIILVSRLKALS